MYFATIESRALILANYVIKYKATVRQTATHFGVSKSLVHSDLTKRLRKINPYLEKKVHTIFAQNKSESHIRGGAATKRKYSQKKR